jgi:hypothetical protein
LEAGDVTRTPAILASLGVALVLTGWASTRPATEVTDTPATLKRSVDPEGVQAASWLQYGTTTVQSRETPGRDAGVGSQVENVSERVTGLVPGTTDDSRVAAQQTGRSPVYGGDRPFATSARAQVSNAKPVFAFYYLWWSREHWIDRLGPNYPYSATPSPLPARLDAGGCSAVSLYPGNTLTDVSQGLAYDQNNPAVIERDVRLAADANLAGFVVNWSGTGSRNQTPTTNSYNRRLQWIFDAVHKVNAEGIRFKLLLDYKSASRPSTTEIANDLNYFVDRYGSDPALDHTYSSKPEVVWPGSWKYTDDGKTSISQAFRSKLYLIGGDKADWDSNSAANFDGNTWYWPGQDPYRNPHSFGQLRAVANSVRSTGNPDGSNKVWLAPLAPGYDPVLLHGGDTCVPRNDGETMRRLFQGNLASQPDGWLLISWNEIAEGSYIVPLTRYGDAYLNVVRSIITASQAPAGRPPAAQTRATDQVSRSEAYLGSG